MDKNKLIISAAVVLMASTGIVLAANSGNSSHVTLSGLAESETYTLTINSPLYTGDSESGIGTTFVKTTNGNDVKVEYNKLSPFASGGKSPFQTGFNTLKYGSYIDIVANGEIEGLAGISSVTIKWCEGANSCKMRVHYGWDSGVYVSYIDEICSPFNTAGIYTFDLPNGPSYIRIDTTTYDSESSDYYTLGLNEISIKYSCVKSQNPYVVGDYVLNLVNNDHFEVVSYKGSSTDLNFPREYGIYPVTAIADNFVVDIGKSNITSVVLPSSITRIGYEAFYDASKLETIDLTHVTSIGDRAFLNCSKLGSTGKLDIYAPEVGSSAFSQTGVTKVAFHSSTGKVTVGESVFWTCTSLLEATFDGELWLKMAGSGLFARCSNMTDATLPVRVDDIYETYTINRHTFRECSKLKNLSYAGTIEQWNSLKKDSTFCNSIPATIVICSDGSTTLAANY